MHLQNRKLLHCWKGNYYNMVATIIEKVRAYKRGGT